MYIHVIIPSDSKAPRALAFAPIYVTGNSTNEGSSIHDRELEVPIIFDISVAAPFLF